MPCVVASWTTADVFWYWTWPLFSVSGDVPLWYLVWAWSLPGWNPSSSYPNSANQLVTLLVEKFKGAMKKLELLMPLSFHMQQSFVVWAQPSQNWCETPQLGRLARTWEQTAGCMGARHKRGSVLSCTWISPAICGAEQLAGITTDRVGMLRNLLCRVRKKGLELFVQLNKNKSC